MFVTRKKYERAVAALNEIEQAVFDALQKGVEVAAHSVAIRAELTTTETALQSAEAALRYKEKEYATLQAERDMLEVTNRELSFRAKKVIDLEAKIEAAKEALA